MIVNLHTPTHSTPTPHTNTHSVPTQTSTHMPHTNTKCAHTLKECTHTLTHYTHTPTQTVPYSTFYPLHQTPRDNGGQDLPGIQEGGADDRGSYTEHDLGEEKRSYKYIYYSSLTRGIRTSHIHNTKNS